MLLLAFVGAGAAAATAAAATSSSSSSTTSCANRFGYIGTKFITSTILDPQSFLMLASVYNVRF